MSDNTNVNNEEDRIKLEERKLRELIRNTKECTTDEGEIDSKCVIIIDNETVLTKKNEQTLEKKLGPAYQELKDKLKEFKQIGS